MTKGKKIIFVVLLVIFISASVLMSFNMISRPTYEFEYTEDYNGTGDAGWIFNGFNGNSTTREVHIDHPLIKTKTKNGTEWIPDESKDVIAVEGLTINSDEYVEYIYIGPSVKYIEERSFIYCKKLRAIEVDENNQNYTDIDGVLYTKDLKQVIVCPNCHCTNTVYNDIREFGEVRNIETETEETFTITGKDVEEMYSDAKHKIGDVTREQISLLKENGIMSQYVGTYYKVIAEKGDTITVEKFFTKNEIYEIPEGVERICSNAFYKCERFVQIKIPSTVREIGDMAFFKCYSVALVSLPDGLRTVGCDSFSYCQSMKYAIFIPESVESIGHHCFYKCDGLESFYMGDKDKSGITLGGKWQPKSENSITSDSSVFGATREQCDAFNAKRTKEEYKPEDEDSNSGGNAADTSEMNRTAVILLIIFVFVPGFAIVAVEVVRNLFKDDFLMTKKGKARLQRNKEEKERIHRSYVNAGAGEEETGETPENENETGGSDE